MTKLWNRFKVWWQSRTLNEKMMYALVAVLVIGIATRWRFVLGEIGEAFGFYFGGR